MAFRFGAAWERDSHYRGNCLVYVFGGQVEEAGRGKLGTVTCYGHTTNYLNGIVRERAG